MEKLEYYQDLAAEDIDNGKERKKLFDKIQDIDDCVFDLATHAPLLAKKDWMKGMKFVSTSASDALKGSTRTLASNTPKVEIIPRYSTDPEYKLAEEIEDNIQYQFECLAKIGNPIHEAVSQALKFKTVAYQTLYLPHYLKDRKEDRIRDVLRDTNFIFRVHDARTINAREDAYGTESITLNRNTTAASIYSECGKDNPGVRKMVSKLVRDPKDTQSILRSTEVTQYLHQSHGVRVEWVALTKDSDDGGGKDVIELYRDDNKLGFLPWVYRSEPHPMLETVVMADLWKNANILRTLNYAMTIATAAGPRIASMTYDGEGVTLQFDEPFGEVTLRVGENITPLPPPQIDPRMMEEISAAESGIFQTTAAKILASPEEFIKANVPYSSFNAAIGAAISQLGDNIRVAENALTDGAYQMMKWVEYSDIPMMGYRKKTTQETPGMMMGDALKFSKGMVDIYDLHCSVKLQPNTLSDEQQRLNTEILKMERLNLPAEEAAENVGVHNYKIKSKQRDKEILRQAAIQLVIEKKKGEIQSEIQAAQQERLMSAQNEAQGMTSNAPLSNAAGMDTRMGQTPMTVAPGLGREQITGETFNGEGIA